MKSLSLLLNLGWFKLTLALALLFGMGWFISDSLGVTFGWIGTLIWVVISLFTAVFGIIYFAQFLTPIAGNDGWWTGLHLILRAFNKPTPQNTRTVEEEKEKKGRRRRKTVTVAAPKNPNDPPPSFKTLNAGILRTYLIFSLVKKGKYIGANGPGFIILKDKESIRHVIDLRVQKRSEKNVRVTTRDGIQITTEVSVRFHIKPANHSRNKHTLYPYDKEAIFQISYADAIDDHGDPLSWQEKIVPQAISFASQEVGKYSLNELTTLEGGVSNIDEINRFIVTEMVKKFTIRGIEILDANISTPVLPEQIRRQYIVAWRAEWEARIQEKYSEGEAQALRRHKQARARAQIEMIDAISRNLEMMQREDDSEMVEILTLRMIEALEQAILADSSRTKIPQTVMANLITDSSKQMRDAAKDDPEEIGFNVPQPPLFNFRNHAEIEEDDNNVEEETE